MFGLSMLENDSLSKGYESGLELLKKAGIYEQSIYLKEGRSVYLTRYNEVQTETATLILGAIVGIASSLLLFYSVNLLYFEQFRREILIKRIPGLRFFLKHMLSIWLVNLPVLYLVLVSLFGVVRMW